MDSGKKTVRALGLSSGGLDSILSGLVLKEQGIEVTWISFETPFFDANKAKKASERSGLPIITRRITPVYMEMLRNPDMGYGKNMNPCPDCHALMFRLAGEVMEAENFDFLFSGEVLGQRPMSQNKGALAYVARRSGYEGRILRPLSARVLPMTLPEREGLVDRDRLLAFSGRSRKPQMALAREMGVTDYPAPAGGCLLTDVGYSSRLRDLLDHEESAPVTERDLELLKHGRHFRLSPGVKAVVGRNRGDNERIEALVDPAKDAALTPADRPGPLVLVPRGTGGEDLVQAARLCAAYSKSTGSPEALIRISTPSGEQTQTVDRPEKEAFADFLL